MRKILLLSLLFILAQAVKSQVNTKEIEGVISYCTAQNIYVKFSSARNIKPGDKIFQRKNGVLVPVILVDNSSSLSCVGRPVSADLKLKAGDKVFAIVPLEKEKEEDDSAQKINQVSVPDTTSSKSGKLVQKTPAHKERLDGRFQFASYSNFSNMPSGENHRLRYILSLNVANMGNSRTSFESYISFSHKLNDYSDIKENIFNGLKIYSLNFKIDAGDHNSISFGRKINPRIASIGAIDGLQFEGFYNHFFYGLAGGLRPDYSNYGFNANLLEYGAYVGHTSKNNNGLMQSTVAFFEQTNGGKTDRRYAYFQHDNSLVKGVNLFATSEVDLYRVVNGQIVTDPILTSLYVSLNLQLSRKISLSTSYDNRRNVIFYETYKSYVDLLLADATRQGVQMRINYRPIPYVNLGISSSYWARDNDIRPTKNASGFFTFTSIPFVMLSASLTANYLETSYVNGSIYGIRLDKDLFKGKLNWSLGYRYVDYLFQSNSEKLVEHIAESDFSVQFTRKFSMSINYEGTFEKEYIYHRIYFSAIKRF